MLGFDIPTFVFQIINFLVLLAILTKFFYRPVLDVMAKRQEQIDARIADAEQRAHLADEEREQLAKQSQTAARAASALVESARNEAAQERRRLLDAARSEAAAIIEAARKTAAAEEQATLDQLGTRLSQSAVNIAGMLIRGTSGEAVHQHLVDALLSDGFGLDDSARKRAHLDSPKDGGRLVVESAYPVDASLAQRLRSQAALVLTRPVDEFEVEVHEDASLIAGMRLLMGGLVVDMTVKHLLEELAGQEGGQ